MKQKILLIILVLTSSFSIAQNQDCKNQWKNDLELVDCVCSPPPTQEILGLLDYPSGTNVNCFMFPDLIVSGWMGQSSLPDGTNLGEGMKIYQLGEQITPDRDPTPRIRIRGALGNIGEGPFILSGDVISSSTAYATQLIFAKNTDGEKQEGTINDNLLLLDFADHAQHNHFHIPNFLNITLRNSDDAIVSTAKKVSYCVRNSIACNLEDAQGNALNEYCGDSNSYDIDDINNFDLGEGLDFDFDCELQGGEGLMAITPGHLDIYNNNFDGNSLSVAGVCPGSYKIVMIVDEENKLIESDETNNTTEILNVEIEKKESYSILHSSHKFNF